MPDELIIHIITRLEPGGSAQNVIDSAVYQARNRKVLLVAGPHLGKERLSLNLPENAQYLEVMDLVREISPLKDLRAFLRLFKIISSLSPDIVHTHAAKAGMLGRWAAWLANTCVGAVSRAYGPQTANLGKKKRAVIIHTPHGHVFYGYFGPVKTFIFKLAEQLTGRVTDRFIALTEGERRESLERGLGSAADWAVIHSGVRFEERRYEHVRRGLGIAGDETVVAVVARLEPVKGVEYFIRAAAELRKRGSGGKLRYLVVGDGYLSASLIKLADDLGLGGSVLFAGFQRDVYRYLSVADIYVQPSLNEGMGRTALEAQYMKLPVVASRVCGLPDAVEDGVTGLLVPPGNPAALAAAVERLLKDEPLRRRMGEAGRLRVLEKDSTGHARFSAESMNIQLENFYNKVLTEERAAAGRGEK